MVRQILYTATLHEIHIAPNNIAPPQKKRRITHKILTWNNVDLSFHENDERYQLDATIMIYYHK